MATPKRCLTVLALVLILAHDAFPSDYTWDDYRAPFTQLVGVPMYTSGTSTVHLDLPEDLIKTREKLTLNLDVESNIILKIDALEQKTFERWSAYCSVNSAGFFGKHRLRVNDLPPRQTCSIVIATKDLKAGRNTLEFSMSTSDSTVDWSRTYGKVGFAYGIHKMWFSEFSAPPQEPPVQKAREAPPASKPSEVYLVKAVSAVSVSQSGKTCGTSTATLYVQGNVVKASGRSSSGNEFEASGTIDPNGQIRIGVASGRNVFATFTGTLSSDSGSGIWQDQSQCYGTWSATRQEQVEPFRKQPHRDVETRPETAEKIKLRHRAEKDFSDQNLEKMIRDRNFFNVKFNPDGRFPNGLVNNGDGTVTDKVTGLMWQKGGSTSEMSYHAVSMFLDELNSSRFGGYGDWRLPTMEELCSLLKGTQNHSGKFIDDLFDSIQSTCWSADENPHYIAVRYRGAFSVDFTRGETSAGWAERSIPPGYGGGLAQTRYYVRAVRTAE